MKRQDIQIDELQSAAARLKDRKGSSTQVQTLVYKLSLAFVTKRCCAGTASTGYYPYINRDDFVLIFISLFIFNQFNKSFLFWSRDLW